MRKPAEAYLFMLRRTLRSFRMRQKLRNSKCAECGNRLDIGGHALVSPVYTLTTRRI